MNFKSFALASIVAISAIGGLTTQAQAYGGGGTGCRAPNAVNAMEDALAGGATLKQAWLWAIDDGYAVDTTRCWTVVKGYAWKYQSIKPAFSHFVFN